jgi:hypothetical protein
MTTRTEQLVLAAQTVNKKTPRKRVKHLLRQLAAEQARQGKPDPALAAVIYYLSIGTVPRPLWDNG